MKWATRVARGGLGCALAVAACASSPLVRAESRCWPEEALVGHRAEAYVWGGGGAVVVPTYSARGQHGAPVPCQTLAYLRGGCEEETALLPFEWSRTVSGLARTNLRSGEVVWVRPADQSQPWRAVMRRGQSGYLFPRDAIVRAAPSMQARPVTLSAATQRSMRVFIQTGPRPWPAVPEVMRQVEMKPPHSLSRISRAAAEVRNTGGTWVRVVERLAYPSDKVSTPRLGPGVRAGYVLHRDRGGVLRTVISDIWCD